MTGIAVSSGTEGCSDDIVPSTMQYSFLGVCIDRDCP